MRILIALVVFLCATSYVSVADGEEAGELRMDKNCSIVQRSTTWDTSRAVTSESRFSRET